MGHCCCRPLPQTLISRGGVVFHTENISFPGLTLKHVPRSSRMAPMDIMHTTSYCCSIVILAVSLTISALQSILRQNDLAGRLWPLNDSEGQSGSPPKWNHLETGKTFTWSDLLSTIYCELFKWFDEINRRTLVYRGRQSCPTHRRASSVLAAAMNWRLMMVRRQSAWWRRLPLYPMTSLLLLYHVSTSARTRCWCTSESA